MNDKTNGNSQSNVGLTGEREAFEAWYQREIAPRITGSRAITKAMTERGWQARAAWQRTQSAGVTDEFEPDSVCEEADGCPTELAVLKRFWRENRARELSSPIREAIKWVDHLLFECGALTHTRAPSVHVYNKTFAAVEAAKAMLAADPAPEPVSPAQPEKVAHSAQWPTTPGLSDRPSEVQRLLEWAVDRWHAEVASRPLANVHRRTLDDTWRQIIRKLGGDAGLLCGPAHDDLSALATSTAQQGEGSGE